MGLIRLTIFARKWNPLKIAINSCSCHYKESVVLCKNCSDHFVRVDVKAKEVYTEFELQTKNVLVISAPELYQCAKLYQAVDTIKYCHSKAQFNKDVPVNSNSTFSMVLNVELQMDRISTKIL